VFGDVLVRVDPNFALAYARLGTVYHNTYELELAEQYHGRAYELRDRAGERERFYITEHYYESKGQIEKRIQTLEVYRQTYPTDSSPTNNLAMQYSQLGRFEETLRESEERYRMIFDKGQIGIAVSDLEGRLLLTNPSFQRMLGYTESELQNKNFRELTLDTDLPEENRYVSELIEGKRDGYDIEKRYIRKDGGIIWVEIAASMLRNVEGKPAFGVVMALDINDRKSFEEALRESNKKVHEYANKLKT
jgi:PAS domain S-box-containing protein